MPYMSVVHLRGHQREAAMAREKKPGRVREPVQVYLDPQDRELLDRMAERSGISRAELMRRGLRKLAGDVLAERPPGWSLDMLIGCLGDDPTLPRDLSTRHDEYLYGPLSPLGKPRSR